MPGYNMDYLGSGEVIATTNFVPANGSTYYCMTRNGATLDIGSGYEVYHNWRQANFVAQAYNSGALDPSNAYGVVSQIAS